jgi:hypothetical protein
MTSSLSRRSLFGTTTAVVGSSVIPRNVSATTEDTTRRPFPSTFQKRCSLICGGAWRRPAGLTGKQPKSVRSRVQARLPNP